MKRAEMLFKLLKSERGRKTLWTLLEWLLSDSKYVSREMKLKLLRKKYDIPISDKTIISFFDGLDEILDAAKRDKDKEDDKG